MLGVSGEMSADVLYWAKVSRLSGLQGPVGSGGQDLLVTEVARIYEALGREPSLSEHFFWTGLASRVIMEHGTAWLTVSSSSLTSHLSQENLIQKFSGELFLFPLLRGPHPHPLLHGARGRVGPEEYRERGQV